VRQRSNGRRTIDADVVGRHGHTVRTIILLRHGKSSWSDSTLADVDRPLAPRGERASKRIAKYMREKRIRPALVLCSPSLRTRQTLAAIDRSLGKACTVELVPQLYLASGRELFEQLRALPESVGSVMLIGHNPGLQNLALVLASGGADLPRLEGKFPTGALATLAVDCEGWAALKPGDAEIVDYVVPRQLG
jgi:phosphohistidine phosphatase